jgi:hypothetical protein
MPVRWRTSRRHHGRRRPDPRQVKAPAQPEEILAIRTAKHLIVGPASSSRSAAPPLAGRRRGRGHPRHRRDLTRSPAPADAQSHPSQRRAGRRRRAQRLLPSPRRRVSPCASPAARTWAQRGPTDTSGTAWRKRASAVASARRPAWTTSGAPVDARTASALKQSGTVGVRDVRRSPRRRGPQFDPRRLRRFPGARLRPACCATGGRNQAAGRVALARVLEGLVAILGDGLAPAGNSGHVGPSRGRRASSARACCAARSCPRRAAGMCGRWCRRRARR